MKIFVTGAAGFIGSHVVGAALAAGHEVVALNRSGRPPRIPLQQEPEWLSLDIVSLEVKHFEDVEALIHCAAHTPNHPYDTWESCLRGNALLPLGMLDKARKAGVNRFIIAGSAFEYGRSAERYEQVPVHAPLEATASYPASKAAASVMFSSWARAHAARLAILRIFQVYGPGEAEVRLWPSLQRAAEEGWDFALNPGELIRDFIRVEDVASALVCAVEFLPLEPGEPEIHNIGRGVGQKLSDFAGEWWRIWGAKGTLQLGVLPYRAGEILRCVAEPSNFFQLNPCITIQSNLET